MFVRTLVMATSLSVSVASYAMAAKASEVEKKKEDIIQSEIGDRVRQAVKANASAVVLIYTLDEKLSDNRLIYNSALNQREKNRSYSQGVCSGVVISPNGWVVTTYDSVKNCSKFIVSIDSEYRDPSNNAILNKTENDYIVDNKKVKLIPELNLAFLKIESKASDFKCVKFGNDEPLIADQEKIIENGVVVGKAKGERFVDSKTPANSRHNFSIIARLAQKISYKEIKRKPVLLLESQDVGPIVYPENSGGALIAGEGNRLLGLACFEASNDGLITPTSYAIPVSVIRKGFELVEPSVLEKVESNDFGISVKDSDDKKYPIVESVKNMSIADELGIKPGDIILKINGNSVDCKEAYENAKNNSIGQGKVPFVFQRGTRKINIEIPRR